MMFLRKLSWPILLAGLLLMVPLSVWFGSTDIPALEVLKTLMRELTGQGEKSDPTFRAILLEVRLPRIALVALVGAAMSLVGGVLQATFRNPLADPGVLGVSAGGGLGAVVAIFLGLTEIYIGFLPLFAFMGAMAAILLVFFLSNIGGTASTTSLLLTGVAIGSLATALMSYFLIISGTEEMREILFWLVGGAEGRTWDHVKIGLFPIGIGAALLLGMHRQLDALLLGEEQAQSVGVSLKSTRTRLMFLSAVVAGTAVSVCGAVGFVGLIVPHILRLMTGPRALRLLPACIFGGALFLMTCDLLARVISRNHEVQMGIVSSLLGVPFFIFLLIRSKRVGMG